MFTFNNAVLESENYTMSIGDNRTVDYVFSTTVGDPSAANAAGSSAGSMQMTSSGVYELLQVIETGVSTDTANTKLNDIAYGHAVAANDEVLVVGDDHVGKTTLIEDTFDGKWARPTRIDPDGK